MPIWTNSTAVSAARSPPTSRQGSSCLAKCRLRTSRTGSCPVRPAILTGVRRRFPVTAGYGCSIAETAHLSRMTTRDIAKALKRARILLSQKLAESAWPFLRSDGLGPCDHGGFLRSGRNMAHRLSVRLAQRTDRSQGAPASVRMSSMCVVTCTMQVAFIGPAPTGGASASVDRWVEVVLAARPLRQSPGEKHDEPEDRLLKAPCSACLLMWTKPSRRISIEGSRLRWTPCYIRWSDNVPRLPFLRAFVQAPRAGTRG